MTTTTRLFASHHQLQENEEEQEVNRIFANNTIEQVAATCRQMQSDVRNTQLELRQMVGNRHRELIDCCGELVGIDKVCRELQAMCDNSTSHNNNSNITTNNNNDHDRNTKSKTRPDASSAPATSAVRRGRDVWHRQHMLQAMRATSLVEEGQLLHAAVQISQLDRDVALGAQSLSMDYCSSEATAKLHALTATVRPLKGQWEVAAAKALARLTAQEASSNATLGVGATAGASPVAAQVVASSSTASSLSAAAPFILASCFQGWGLLAHSTPAEAMQHLLDSLCPAALERISLEERKKSSSNKNDSLARASRLLVAVASFLVDLYKRGPHALITASDGFGDSSTAGGAGGAAAALPSASALSAAAGLSSLLLLSAGGAASRGATAGAVQDLVRLREEGGQFAALSSTNDAAAYLKQVSHQVCALGVLDAAASIGGSGTNNGSANAVSGWASPISSPEALLNNNSNSNTPSSQQQSKQQQLHQKTLNELLPPVAECAQMFNKACDKVFGDVLTNLVEHATDPAAGEAIVEAIVLAETKRLLATASPLAQELVRAVEQVRRRVATAAGTCILQHLSESALRLQRAALGTDQSDASTSQQQQEQQQRQQVQGDENTIFGAMLSLVPRSADPSTASTAMAGISALTSEHSSLGTAHRNGRDMLASLVLRRNSNNSNSNTKQHNSHINQINNTPASKIIARVTRLTQEAVAHARSALRRSTAVGDDTAAERVTKTILELTAALCDAARSFFVKSQQQQQQQQQMSTSVVVSNPILAGIAAAECVRSACEPLIALAADGNASSSNNKKILSMRANDNITAATRQLHSLQADLLGPWRDAVLSAFQRDAGALAAEDATEDSSIKGYCAPVLSGSWLLCRTEHKSAAVAAAAPPLQYPNRPSPVVSSALVSAIRRGTAQLLTSGGGCPVHVRLELCAAICGWVLDRGLAIAPRIITAASAFTATERDQRLLQLYFDVMFVVLALRGSSGGTDEMKAVFAGAGVDSKRKLFQEEIQRRVDVVTWSVAKPLVNSALKAAVDEASFVATMLPAVLTAATSAASSSSSNPSTPTGPRAAPSSGSARNSAAVSALLPAVEQPCERLPLLPLVSLAPAAHSMNLAAGAGGGGGGGGGVNLSAGGGAAGDGFASGVGASTADGGGAGTTMSASASNAAQQILGSAVTDRLKSVLKWF